MGNGGQGGNKILTQKKNRHAKLVLGGRRKKATTGWTGTRKKHIRNGGRGGQDKLWSKKGGKRAGQSQWA